jgi:glycosyltransferase involved in cell wall biosynthesis
MICHMVTSSFDVSNGGVAQSSVRIARHLASAAKHVYFYSLHPGDGSPSSEWPLNVETISIGPARVALCEPLGTTASSGSGEVFTAEFLLLRSSIAKRIDRSKGAGHLIISFFASHAGFLAQHLSISLNLPHLASLRGSDFTRDLRHPSRFAAVAFVLLGASVVVTTNLEQEKTVAEALNIRHKLVTIYNAVRSTIRYRRPLESLPIRIVSDCGYSFKKGTYILIKAVSKLLAQGLPVHLTIVGPTESNEASFWCEIKKDRRSNKLETFALRDWVPREDVEALLIGGHIYASATLGEGSSNARLGALACGIPMVTTRCGTLADIADGEEQVVLCEPGEEAEFFSALEGMVRRVLVSDVSASDVTVAKWRDMLDEEREGEQWRKVAERALRGIA